MAPGPIPRDYATQEQFDKLKQRVERMSDSMIVMLSVMKMLTCKIYGSTPDESAQEILDRTLKMVDSWD